MSDRCRLRKYRLALLGLAILSPLLAFGISNLFLLSPKGRDFIAGKIGNRLHLETSVEGATWSPWGGITVYGIRIEQPGALRNAFARPLLTVQSLQIHPDWRALMGKMLVARGVKIVKPELHVPIELLSQIPSTVEEPALAATTTAAANPLPDIGSSPVTIASQPLPDPPLAGINHTGGENTPVSKASAAEVRTPNIWINVREGRLGIVSLMSDSTLFEAAGIDGSVPIYGKPAKSWITVSRLRGLGQQSPSNVTLPLQWTAPLLGTGISGGEMFGLDFNFVGHIALVKGIPFRFDASIPEQNDREIRIGKKFFANLGKVASQGRVQGFLKAPALWQGKWIARTTAVDVEIEGHKNRFDHGRMLMLFQNGALRCLDARLSSEEATIMVNGMILSDGRMAANTRIVAAPEALAAISRFTQPDSETAHFTALSTPQRAALDLEIFGYPGSLLYKPNPKATPIPLR